MRAATVLQVAGLVLCFIAFFISLVIAPLDTWGKLIRRLPVGLHGVGGRGGVDRDL